MNNVARDSLIVLDDWEFNVQSKLVKITEEALKKIASYMFANDEYGALVIATESGGCAGQRYVMSVILQDDYKAAKDLHVLATLNRSGEKIEKVIATRNDSVLYIAGMQVDYIANETGGGFLFSNPNASSSCGCGESFSTGSGGGNANGSCGTGCGT